MFTSVLVPLDGSELAEGILPYVAQIAGGVGARITLITVVDPDMLEIPAALRGESSGGRVPAREREQAHTRRHEESGPFVQQILENVERRAEANLREVAERLREQGANAEGRVVLGTPAEQIARFAEDEGCDLIAMSTHGRNLIARGVLGSVTDKVIHSVGVPVLAITPERARKYHQEPAAQMTSLLAPLDGSELAESRAALRRKPRPGHAAQSYAGQGAEAGRKHVGIPRGHDLPDGREDTGGGGERIHRVPGRGCFHAEWTRASRWIPVSYWARRRPPSPTWPTSTTTTS